ncbi:PRC-barrel domain-containing protein [Schlesneria sp. T3-172]|uniref:PRC-barrel domain-containing protein n=1 Tax=Schlesneria sphaerica TaxID=3373610 RepID=UPI0037CA174D
MKNLLVKVSAIALFVSGQGIIPVLADDQVEGKAAVPTRGDGAVGESEIYRASEVIGLPVKDDGGQEVGKIKDLVINGGSSEVLYAVVAMNEAEEKDTVYVMPWTVFQPSFGDANVIQFTTLTIPQTVWVKAPYFQWNRWRQAPYTQWGPRVNEYYSQQSQIGVRGLNRGTNVRVNKPALRDDNDDDRDPQSERRRSDDARPNNSDSDRNRNEASKNNPDRRTDKPTSNDADRPTPERSKPAPDAKNTDRPGADAPRTNTPKPPAPRGNAPAEPKKPAPVPNEPKPNTPNPK